jgi:hypothetical protein
MATVVIWTHISATLYVHYLSSLAVDSVLETAFAVCEKPQI